MRASTVGPLRNAPHVLSAAMAVGPIRRRPQRRLSTMIDSRVAGAPPAVAAATIAPQPGLTRPRRIVRKRHGDLVDVVATSRRRPPCRRPSLLQRLVFEGAFECRRRRAVCGSSTTSLRREVGLPERGRLGDAEPQRRRRTPCRRHGPQVRCGGPPRRRDRADATPAQRRAPPGGRSTVPPSSAAGTETLANTSPTTVAPLVALIHSSGLTVMRWAREAMATDLTSSGVT